MDIFKTINAGLAALRGGDYVLALACFSEVLGVVLRSLGSEAAARALKAPQAAQSPVEDGGDDEDATAARIEQKAAALKAAGTSAAPSSAAGTPPAAISWIGILPDILQIIDIIRRRLGR